MKTIIIKIKNIFLTKNNLRKKIDAAMKKAADEERCNCMIEKKKEIYDITLEHEMEIKDKEVRINEYKKQHKKDIEAYRLYRENLKMVNEIYETIENVAKDEFMSVVIKYRDFKAEVDNINRMVRDIRKVAPKIEKLHGNG